MGFPCPRGYKCHQNGATNQFSRCPRGTFQALPAQSDCDNCPRGYFCPDEGEHTPRECPVGKYCPEKTYLPRDCPPGTFNEKEGAFDLAHCQVCPPGYGCPGGDKRPGDRDRCRAGFFCKEHSPSKTPALDEYGNGPCPRGKIFCLTLTYVN